MLFAKIALAVPGQPAAFLEQGQRVPDGMFDDATLARFLKKGYVVEFSPEVPVPAKGPGEEKKEAGDGSPTPAWNFKPSDLEGKSLEALNMMIMERALEMKYPEEVPVFEDIETALLFMTSEAS